MLKKFKNMFKGMHRGVRKGIVIVLSICISLSCMSNIIKIDAAFTTVVNWTTNPGVGTTLQGNTVYQINGNLSINTSGNTPSNGLNVAPSSTVVLFIPEGSSLNVKGGNSNGQSRGYAGIYVPSTSTLIVTGGGQLTVTGGNAGSGEMGIRGDSPYYTNGGIYLGGSHISGTGGAGGGGAGAAIGGYGGTGGAQTPPPADADYRNVGSYGPGSSGSNGYHGSNGASMGNLYVLGDVNVTATGGSAGTHRTTNSYGGTPLVIQSTGAGGGGAGGNGGYGWNAAAIGGGGPGGGSGGSGGLGGAMTPSIFGWGNAYFSAGGNGGGGGAPSGLGGKYGGSSTNWGADGYNANVTAGGGVRTFECDSRIRGGNGGAGGNRGSSGGSGNLFASRNIGGRAPVSNVTSNSNIQYTLTLDGDGATTAGTTSYMATLGVKGNTNVTTPRKTGYTFKGYYSQRDGNGTQYFDEIGNMVKEWDQVKNVTLYAYWTPDYYSFNLVSSIVKEGVEGSVAFTPSGKALPNETVQVKLASRGKATASGIHTLTIYSATLGSTFTYVFPYQVGKNTTVAEERMTSFKMPSTNINDIVFTHEVIQVPDIYNQTYTYDGIKKAYTIADSFNGIRVGTILYEKAGGSPTATPPTDAGEYTVTIPLIVDGKTVNISKLLTINPKLLEWDVEDIAVENKEYDSKVDAKVSGNIKIKGMVSKDDVSLTNAAITKGTFDSATADKGKFVTLHVNDVKLTGASKANYQLPAAAPQIKADINGMIPNIIVKNPTPSSEYDGNILQVSEVFDFVDPTIPSIVLDGVDEKNITYEYYTDAKCTMLTSDKDGATSSGSAPVNAGTYWLKAIYTPDESQAQYSATISTPLKIIVTSKTISPHITWVNAQDGFVYNGDDLFHDYNGKAIEPKVVVYEDATETKRLIQDVDYKVTYTSNTNAGTANAVITLKGNYVGVETKAFEITKGTYDLSAIKMSNQVVDFDKRAHNVTIDDIYELLKVDTALKVRYTYTLPGGSEVEEPPCETGLYTVKAYITTSSKNWKFSGVNEAQFVLTSTLEIKDVNYKIEFQLHGGNIAGSTSDVVWDAPQYRMLKDYPGGIPNPTMDGYALSGWESDGVIYSGNKVGDEEVHGKRTFKAVWEKQSSVVVFDANGGEFDDKNTTKRYEQPFHTSFEFSKVAVPTKSHRVFVGWGVKNDDTEKIPDKTFVFDSLSAKKTY